MTSAAASDPFESTANAARYVPRPACERVLEAIELALARGAGPVAITGPAGLGKSMLLSVLAQRVGGRYRVVRLPYPALSAAELCRWVLESLGDADGAASDDPEGALLDRAFRESAAGRETLLLVDDASSLPPRTARGLATLVSASGGAVRAVLAAVDDARLGAALAALGAGAREIRFDEPMDAEETNAYVRARCAAAGVRGGRFDADTLARLYGATGGIPRLVHELGSAIWRSPDGTDLPALVERWARGDEDREADSPAEPIEIDEGASVLEVGAEDEDGTIDEGNEPLAPRDADEAVAPGKADEAVAPPPPLTAQPDGTRRARGLWLVLVALALLVVALPQMLPQLERWLDAGLPEPPAAEGARREYAPPPVPPPAQAADEAREPDETDASFERPDAWAMEADASTAGDEPAGLEAEPEALADPESPVVEPEPAASEAAPPSPAQPEPDPSSPESETPTPDAPEPEASAPEPEASAPAPEPEPEASAPGSDPPAPEPAATPPPPEPPAAPAPEAAAPRRPRGIEVRVETSAPAVIHVDGGRVGTTPLAPLDLSPGLHVFRAEFASGRAMVRAVEISASNRRVTFEPSAEPEPPAVAEGEAIPEPPGSAEPPAP